MIIYNENNKYLPLLKQSDYKSKYILKAINIYFSLDRIIINKFIQ